MGDVGSTAASVIAMEEGKGCRERVKGSSARAPHVDIWFRSLLKECMPPFEQRGKRKVGLRNREKQTRALVSSRDLPTASRDFSGFNQLTEDDK